ncbi:MAG: hypothetical protein ORN54_04670 [Cyclobacteriaceae bacterium]|nr:hypothetical protein [Cyclobacteriaceae bacterium]
MKNFELIDDYLTNRLSGESKIDFEKQIELDPSLKADLQLQKVILESVKKARAAELKAMLQNVPIGGSAGITQFSVMKMAAGVIGAGLLIAGLSYYFKNSSENGSNMSTSLEDSIKKVSTDDFEPLEEPLAITPEEEKKDAQQTPLETKLRIKSTENPIKTAIPAINPKMDLVDPTKDMIEGDSRPVINQQTAKSPVSISQIKVDVLSENKKYSFHYQFSEGKFLLYGDFDKPLYEILEINDDATRVFMFYKEQYYLLDEKQTKATPLQPITDLELISKLREYRGR